MMNRKQKISSIHKISSKLGERAAKGLNFNHAEEVLIDRAPEVEPTKERVLSEVESRPLINSDQILEIVAISLDDRLIPITSKAEKAFLELGSFLSEKEDKLTEIVDFLVGAGHQSGWISKNFNVTPISITSIKDEFAKLNAAQEEWHFTKAREQEEESIAQGKFGNGYETNDVRYEFGDGWKVVYVPAIGEGPDYKGNSSKSNDRTIEGNILGLCLGSASGMYQDNELGKIYSVRDPGNNPKVTIRIHDNELHEAKGKNNLPPSVEGASRASQWFALQDGLEYRETPDFKSFPPLTAEEAEKAFLKDEDAAWRSGWIVHWYRAGIDTIDLSVQKAVDDNSLLVLKSGLAKKYKELAQPVAKHWADRWLNGESSLLWGPRLSPYEDINLQELWKTYKKEPWMKEAVHKLFERNYEKEDWSEADHPDYEPPNKYNRGLAFGLRIHKLNEFEEYANKVARDLVEHRPEVFFQENIADDYSDYATAAAKNISKNNPRKFFEGRGSWGGVNEQLEKYLGDDYRKHEREALSHLVSDDPEGFFAEQLDRGFPELEDIAAENLVAISPKYYFDREYIRVQNRRPDLRADAASGLAQNSGKRFFENKLHNDFPELIPSAIESVVDKDPEYFYMLEASWTRAEPSKRFRYYNKITPRINLRNIIPNYDEYRRKAAENIASQRYPVISFFNRLKLHHDYPDMGRGIAKKIVDGEILPDRYPETVGIFFKLGLNDFYPDLGLIAAKLLFEHNALDFYQKGIDKIYPELVESIEGGDPSEDEFPMEVEEGIQEEQDNAEKLSSLQAYLANLGLLKEAGSLAPLIKEASKAGQKGARGMNFSHAKSQLSKEDPNVELSKDRILNRVFESPLFSDEDLNNILEIDLEENHAKRVSKAERVFLEIGSFLSKEKGDRLDSIKRIIDYTRSLGAGPGWISENYNISLLDSDLLIGEFKRLDEAQAQAHAEAARRDAEEKVAAGQFGNGYMTNEIVHEFEDGWKVVYVPAIGEGPNYKGDSSKSNDRTIEGNILGLCLGATQGLYQDNEDGKIYSVRDPGNNPKVTIRIHDNVLEEAKGKGNLSPSFEGAKKAAEWFALQPELYYEDSEDFLDFPPLTAEEAEKKFAANPDNAYEDGWIVHWYRSGINSIDNSVNEKISSNDRDILRAGFNRKYKELVGPVFKYWANYWNKYGANSDSMKIFEPESYTFDFSLPRHEMWKVYKKESWMKEAVKNAVTHDFQRIAWVGLHNIPEYKDIIEPEARQYLSDDAKDFFTYGLHEAYPDMARSEAESIMNRSPIYFFEFNMQGVYDDLIEEAVGKLLSNLQTGRLSGTWNSKAKSHMVRLNGSHPDILRLAIERWAESANISKANVFFSLQLHKLFSDLAEPMANVIIEDWPQRFFSLNLQDDLPKLADAAAKAMVRVDPELLFKHEVNWRYNLQEAFPEALELAIKLKPRVFFDFKLEGRWPELRELTAKLMAKDLPGDFFEYALDKTFPELSESAAKRLPEQDPQHFLFYGFEKVYPELGRLAAENLAEKDPWNYYHVMYDGDLMYDENLYSAEGVGDPEYIRNNHHDLLRIVIHKLMNEAKKKHPWSWAKDWNERAKNREHGPERKFIVEFLETEGVLDEALEDDKEKGEEISSESPPQVRDDKSKEDNAEKLSSLQVYLNGLKLKKEADKVSIIMDKLGT